MQQNTKSATTAGLLGIFLGSVGAHNWYLGEKGKGIAHVCMTGSGILVSIIAGVVLPNVLSLSALLDWTFFLHILFTVASLAMSASAIWGLVEGIIIITQGDAGLAAKGYAVASPVPQAPQGYGPMPQQGYGQPMPPQGYGPMPNQPMDQPRPSQPMGQNSVNGGTDGQ